MEITRNNYEFFFIDYYDNNLSENQITNLFLFLDYNLDLKQEFEEYCQNHKLISDKIYFDDKDFLKIINCDTDVNSANFEKFCIAQIEGDLSENQNIKLEKYISKDSKNNDFRLLYKKTILTSDNSIIFKNKKSLKRNIIIPIYSYTFNRILYASIAASILIILSFNINFDKQIDFKKRNFTNLLFEFENDSISYIESRFSENIETKKTSRRTIEKIEKIKKLNCSEINKEIKFAQISLVEIQEIPIPNAGTENENLANLKSNGTNYLDSNQDLLTFSKKRLSKFLKLNKFPIEAEFDNDNKLSKLAFNSKLFSVEHVFAKN